MRFIPLIVLLLLAGCGSRSSTTQDASSTTGSDVKTAGPHLVTLTNQTQVWSCPTCGMNYDGPGECEMKDGTLALVNVHYVCPVGKEALSGVGKCPTHGADAVVEKTPAAAPDSTG